MHGHRRRSRRGGTTLAAASLVVAAAVALGATAGVGVRADELRGRVELRGKNDKPLAAAEAQHGVAWFVPDAGVAAPRPGTFTLSTRDKQFEPRVLPITAGSTVRFPNADPILHNVFSVSPPQPFDVGLYGPGEGREQRFDEPGLVRVFCNVHHEMVAYLVVLETPYFARPSADGSFVLEGLPAGPGRLVVWQERAEAWERELTLPLAEPVTATLQVTRRRVPRHLDKSGKPYERPGGERYE
jgi:plastocyanin